MTLVTCHTAGCENSGISIDMNLEYVGPDGQTTYVSGVICGVCGQDITDIANEASPQAQSGQVTQFSSGD